MHIIGSVTVLSDDEENRLHEAALDVLETVGVTVENREIVERLSDAGGKVRPDGRGVTFRRQVVEGMIADSDRFEWREVVPSCGVMARTYAGWYLDPETDAHRPCRVPEMLQYLKAATNLGIPCDFFCAPSIPGVPPEEAVLYLNYVSLKFVGRALPSIPSSALAQAAMEMCRAFCSETSADFRQVCGGMPSLHLISPLRLGAEEARTYLLCAASGIKASPGNMSVIGATCPATVAGALAVHLAQCFFTNILDRAVCGGRQFAISGSLAPLDMKTTAQCYSRPEKPLANFALAQMARRYGVPFWPHVGNPDAKRPGAEAGFQKAMGCLSALLCCGKTQVKCGVLSIDEVFSPVQMVIDREIASFLQRIARGFSVTPETLGMDVIREECKPEGMFMASPHTAAHFREEIWEPAIFTRDMFSTWAGAGGHTALDRARDIARDALRGNPPRSRISDQLEKELLSMVERVGGRAMPPAEAT